MRNITFLLLFIAGFIQAQVSLSSDAMNFGDVLTTADKEMAIDVTNTSSASLTIGNVQVFDSNFTYSVPVATIAPSEKVKVRVIFAPNHNLAYNTELIFVLSDGSEHRIDILGNGKYEDEYYDATFNKSYQDLKDALKTILADGYTNLGYSGARDKMYGDIDNVDGKVTCVYTGRVVTMNTRADANNNSINCEHTWPQSKFGSIEPQRADIHHLFPTDVTSNSKRGSYPFGVVSSASWSSGGSKQGGNLFEPRDEQKGATARAMIYFALRYQDHGNFIGSQESILKQWHTNNPPTAWDIQRNDKIFGYQKNRNPLVDHPEFIQRINNIAGTDAKPVITDAKFTEESKSFSNVDGSKERTIFLVNTGNQAITGISGAVSESGNIIVKSTEVSVAVGEVAEIVIGFKDQAEGVYTDKITLNLESQISKTLELPITINLGTASVHENKLNKLKVVYLPKSKTVRVLDMPKNITGIHIYNVEGKEIRLDEISPSFTDIPFYGQSHGAYFVVIETKSEVFTSRFLVY